MLKATTALTNKDFDIAFEHFERAHILSQNDTLLHTSTHWWMCKTALKKKDVVEVFAQSFRIVGALLMSKIWVPKGNTGRGNVSAFKEMPIPDDLNKILVKYG